MKKTRKLALALTALVGVLSVQQAQAFFGFFDDDDDDYWRHRGPYGWHGPYGWRGPYGWGGGPYGYGPYGGWGAPYGWGYPGYGYQTNTQESEPPPLPPLPE